MQNLQSLVQPLNRGAIFNINLRHMPQGAVLVPQAARDFKAQLPRAIPTAES